MESEKSNKIAVVTGAGGTLCSAMAKDLAKQGYQVVLMGRTLEKLQKVEREITAEGGKAISAAADVADEVMVQAAFDKTVAAFGVPQVLINGAGGNQADAITSINEFDEKELEESPDIKGFFNLSMDKFQEVIKINTMGTVVPSYIFGKAMAKQKQGCIINLASMNSFRPLSKVGAYGMAKAGIANFTQWLAAYLAPANIRVNAIAPGFFLNDRSRKLLLTPDGYSDRGANIIAHTPMKAFGEAEQLLGTMNWLIDEKASGFVTGLTVPVDGGFMASSGI